MKRLAILMLLCWVWGCGESVDELTPYVENFKSLQKYSETFVRYQQYLKTEGMTKMASDVEQVMQNYRKDLDALDKPEDKRLRALHNGMIRTIDSALRRLVEPDFPTFVPNAQKAISVINEGGVKVVNNLKKLWTDAGKTEPFPLIWGEVE